MTTLPANDVVGLWDRYHFPLRRLHSLTGIVPIGGFLCEHMFTNVHAWLGREHFNDAVHWLHDLPFLLALEVCFIFIPLAFHGIYGVLIALAGKSNAMQYTYLANWRYALQRITAYIMFVFVIVHLAKFRFAHVFGGEMYVGSADPFALTREGLLNWHVAGLAIPVWVTLAFYVVGTAATVYHFANGIWTFAISWGIAGGPTAQKWIGCVCAAFGILLIVGAALGLHALTAPAA